ncbi:metal-sensitive transcriptional regulator [Streptomyces sp. NPDC048018]|uniref:metal-sensitive transcriptional regulator n=1 Tax=Streptomyces sp. NPDC048018 TaxID=3365499 RepID=UPI00371028CF
MTTTEADQLTSGDPVEPAAEHAPATAHDHGVHGYHKQKDEHLKRLRRIEGQIRGLQRMVDEDVYCIDILTQVSASTKALQSFALQLLEEHLRHCVADAATKGGDEIEAKVEEATKAIARMMRT